MMFTTAFGLVLRAGRLTPLIGAVAFLVQPLDAGAVTVAEVRQAWQKHADAIESIEYRFQQERTESIYKNASNDPFGDPVDESQKKESVTLMSELSFAKVGNKVATHRVAEFWDDQTKGPVEQTQQDCFDGQECRSLYDSSSIRTGRIEETKIPNINLIGYVEFNPLWLAHWPIEKLMQDKGFAIDDMRVTSEGLTCGDSPCVELSMVARRSDDLVQLLYVDANNNFRIVKVIVTNKGIPRREVNIGYEPDAKIGSRVTEWTTTFMESDGATSLAMRSTVGECQVNTPMEKNAFTISFPVGMNIRKNEEWFVQEADGRLRKTEPKEFRGVTDLEGEF